MSGRLYFAALPGSGCRYNGCPLQVGHVMQLLQLEHGGLQLLHGGAGVAQVPQTGAGGAQAPQTGAGGAHVARTGAGVGMLQTGVGAQQIGIGGGVNAPHMARI